MHRFDHHCKWLNNCIGEENYTLFLWLIVGLDVSEVVFIAYCCVFFSQSTEDSFKTRCAEYTGWESSILILIFTGLALLLAVLITFGVTNLVVLNIWLRKIKHMTTYEYIIIQRKNAAKYRDSSAVSQNEGDQQHLSLSQIPLVRGIARTNPVAPFPVLSTEGKTAAGDLKTTTVSPEAGNSDNLS